jgi:hypothetical protein
VATGLLANIVAYALLAPGSITQWLNVAQASWSSIGQLAGALGKHARCQARAENGRQQTGNRRESGMRAAELADRLCNKHLYYARPKLPCATTLSIKARTHFFSSLACS